MTQQVKELVIKFVVEADTDTDDLMDHLLSENVDSFVLTTEKVSESAPRDPTEDEQEAMPEWYEDEDTCPLCGEQMEPGEETQEGEYGTCHKNCPDFDDGKAEPSTKKYTAHFEPQAWIKDLAVAVDPRGPTDWDCTKFVTSPPEHCTPERFSEAVILKSISEEHGFIDVDDVLKDDPAAPAWVREWDGPFTITVTLAEEING